MTKHFLALQPARPPISFEHGFAAPQPVRLQPARGPPCHRSIRRWVKPLALRGVGLLAEGLAVFGLGLGTVAVTGSAMGTLPGPAVVALCYMALLLLLGGVLRPVDGAGTGLALRVLASAFVCMALAAGRSALSP